MDRPAVFLVRKTSINCKSSQIWETIANRYMNLEKYCFHAADGLPMGLLVSDKNKHDVGGNLDCQIYWSGDFHSGVDCDGDHDWCIGWTWDRTIW